MIFKLNETLVFPSPELADEDGLLAVGGDLSVERLILAYSKGIFPWYSDDTPVLWYSPHKRFVLYPQKIKISKSMKRLVKSEIYRVTENRAFVQVINNCAGVKRKNQDGTWIVADMQQAYMKLHEAGIAHSIEVWCDEELVGGLYGVVSGNVFCGESMFSLAPNASKFALIGLCENTQLSLIDCQFHTAHLESMGAEFITRETYVSFLNK